MLGSASRNPTELSKLRYIHLFLFSLNIVLVAALTYWSTASLDFVARAGHRLNAFFGLHHHRSIGPEVAFLLLGLLLSLCLFLALSVVARTSLNNALLRFLAGYTSLAALPAHWLYVAGREPPLPGLPNPPHGLLLLELLGGIICATLYLYGRRPFQTWFSMVLLFLWHFGLWAWLFLGGIYFWRDPFKSIYPFVSLSAAFVWAFLRLPPRSTGAGSHRIVIGENGVSFATDFQAIAAFDASSGALHWTYQPPGGSGGITAATPDGGVSVYDAGNNIIQLDVQGNASTPVPCMLCLWPWAGGLWTSLGAQPALFSGAAVPLTPGFSMLGGNPQGQSAPTPQLEVRIARVQDPNSLDSQLSDDQIRQRVRTALDFWGQKARIGLSWNGTISRVPRCAQDQPQCYPQSVYDLLEVPQNVFTLSELVRRFRTVPQAFKGLQLVFALSAAGGYPFGITGSVNDSFGNPIRYNVAAVGRDATGMVAAHEIGHIFQLSHSGLHRGNLMCGDAGGWLDPASPFICPRDPNPGLTIDQARDARRYAWILADRVKK